MQHQYRKNKLGNTFHKISHTAADDSITVQSLTLEYDAEHTRYEYQQQRFHTDAGKTFFYNNTEPSSEAEFLQQVAEQSNFHDTIMNLLIGDVEIKQLFT